MINLLRAALGAHFFIRKARITKKAVQAMFSDLLSQAHNPGRPLFRAERAQSGTAHYSALCFAYERPVPFLAKESGQFDTVHGFILLVENGSRVALLKSGLDLTPSFKKSYLEPIDRSRVERAIARHDAKFEKLSLRNMTTSKLVLRSKILEARDLENAIVTSSAGRYIPQNYRVRRADGSYSATPSTGRIAVRADRADLDGAILWAGEIIDLLADNGAVPSTFISSFAQPVRLDNIAAGIVPTFFSVDTMGLADAIWEADQRIRLVRTEDNGSWRELNNAEIEKVLAEIEQPLEVVAGVRRSEHELRDADATVGVIRLNKARIALKWLEHPSVEGVFVEQASLAIGTDPGRKSLARHINEEDLFTVLFSDLALAYIEGSLFRDEALLRGGTSFMRHLIAESSLKDMTSEKGDFAVGQREFSADSVFRAIVDKIADEDVLLCDDLGDEWADFIGVARPPKPAAITFYHAKHGGLGMSAKAFHVVVSQAIKNLSRLGLSGEAMAAKHNSWDACYISSDGTTTSIDKRIRGGTRDEVAEKIEETAGAPELLRRVVIVTSSLSRGAVQKVFADAAAGQAPQPSFVQLYWLLTGFFSACAEIGAVGFVVCQP